MKLLYTSFIFFVFAQLSNAQGVFQFESENHDFGTITEGALATHEFVFKNVGDQPIVISEVTASCGCTTPYYTKDPILPGKKGKITATFNSKGRPNAFNKAITIQSNAKNPTRRLFIKGVVKSNEVQEANFAQLHISKRYHSFGNLQEGQSAVVKLDIENKGTQSLTISRLQSECNCVTYDLSKSILQPQEKATLELSYKPKSKEGPVQDIVYIYSNDRRNNKLSIVLAADIKSGKTILKEGKSDQVLGF